ncbi:MAG: M15 family metallopeptidase [Clostridia bacterium]|nr:M15 family metallopeptidase [Clostridia bacterium]
MPITRADAEVHTMNRRKKKNDYTAEFLKIFGICAIIGLALLIVFAVSPWSRDNEQEDKESETSDTLPEFTSAITETEPAETEAPMTEPPATEPPETEPEGYIFEFKADLSAYEQYMEPENQDEYLTLINTKHPLDETYKPTDLIDVIDTRDDGRAMQQLRENASKSLEAMLIEARANGVTDVTATSAYRSYDYQVSLFNQRVAMYSNLPDDQAYAKAATIVAIPGTSEHQSGLCVDIHNNPYGADVSFENTGSGAWLAANSYKFGFILRFPKDKTEITGISFEPWHFRYVGRYHASKMYELGYCLEEYFDYLGLTDDLDYIDKGEEINERKVLS